IGIGSEHRYDVTLAFEGSNHHGVRASAAGCAAANFEGHLETRRQTKTGPPARKPIDQTAKACRTPVPVQQRHEWPTRGRVGTRSILHRFLSSRILVVTACSLPPHLHCSIDRKPLAASNQSVRVRPG